MCREHFEMNLIVTKEVPKLRIGRILNARQQLSGCNHKGATLMLKRNQGGSDDQTRLSAWQNDSQMNCTCQGHGVQMAWAWVSTYSISRLG